MAEKTVPDFTALSEAEQRAVAERLLRIAESGWKPFWCPDHSCNGSPHPERDENGALIFVDDDAIAGPNGEPVANAYETASGGVRTVLDGKLPFPHEPFLGRVVLNEKWAHSHARVDQRLPAWLKPWVLFIMSGRGAGKTRTGVEFVTLSARRGLDGAIIGRRGTELVNTHVAALIEHAHPDFMPTYHASKDLITWPNGAITYLFSAERPENIRSVNLSYFWMDEAAFMDEVETAWMNARMATRIEKPDNPIHILITSTPTATKWVMEREDDDEVEVRRVSTYANRANLSPDYLKMLEVKYEGTRMGRQELHGEVLRDVEGALWNDEMYVHARAASAEEFEEMLDSFDDTVVAVDPAGSKGPRSDATGIIGVAARHTDDAGEPLRSSEFTALCDATIKGTPTEWARQAFKAARLIRASRIVAEKNFGGDMVKQVLTDYAEKYPDEAKVDGDDIQVKVVQAVKSKETRAEGVVGKYEQGRVTHLTSPTVFGDLSKLEKEQTTWVPKSRGGRSPSPNRIDALVWAMREVEGAQKYEATMASKSRVNEIIRHRQSTVNADWAKMVRRAQRRPT